MTEKSKGNGDDDKLPRVRFHYIKSPLFRTIHASGGIGGLTPQGLIHLAIYSERAAIPRELIYPLNKDGTLSATPDETVGREGYVREIDVDLMMSVDTAKGIRDWLDIEIGKVETQSNKKQVTQ